MGPLIERYLGISTMLYGGDWVFRLIAAIMLALSLKILLNPLYKRYRSLGGIRSNLGAPRSGGAI